MSRLVCVSLVLLLAGCGGRVRGVSGGGSTTQLDAGSVDSGQSSEDSGCGGPGQGCCLGVDCNSGGCCVEGACVAEGATCGASLGTCANKSCRTCGGDGQTCCNNTSCAASDLLCLTLQGNGGTCTSQCGGIGQPCCQQNYSDQTSLMCKNGAVCLEDVNILLPPNTVCFAPSTCGYSAGQCTTCGLPGQPCCVGGLCVPGAAQCLSGLGAPPGTCSNETHPEAT